MKKSEVVLNRIDRLTAGLSRAVSSTGGAEFALMLSMIADSQALAGGLQRLDEEAETLAPANRHDLYTADIVGRLGRALQTGNMADLQLLLSWLDTVPLSSLSSRKALEPTSAGEGVALAQAAHLAKQYAMWDEVQEARHLVAA